MLINSIKLKNYRQFKDVEIQFVESSVVPKPNNGLNELDFTSTSYNPKRQNIIYIQAENSVGKTNLESAFLWGLYGTVDDRGNLLNQEVEEQLKVASPIKPNGEERVEEVEVEIEFEHTNYAYICTRTAFFKKVNDVVKPDGSVRLTLKVSKHDPNTGEFKNMGDDFSEDAVQRRINNILPCELARYFFFKGEGINKIAQEISGCLQGKANHSKVFKEAVERLLGLKYLTNLQNHLERIIEDQDKKIKKVAKSSDLQELLKKIEIQKQGIEKLKLKYHSVEANLKSYKEQYAQIEHSLQSYDKEQVILDQKNKIKLTIQQLEEKSSKEYQELQKFFGRNGYRFIEGLFAQKAQKLPSASLDDGIEASRELIESILKKGTCICGEKLSSKAIEKLTQLKENFMDLNSANALNEFRYACNIRGQAQEQRDYLQEINDRCENLERIYEDYDKAQSELEELNKEFIDNSNVSDLLLKSQKLRNDIQLAQDECRNEKEKIDLAQKELDGLIEQRDKAAKKDDCVKVEERIRQYASALLEKSNNEYEKLSVDTRERFSERINEYYKTIFGQNVEVEVSKFYGLKLIDAEKKNEIFNSDGQGDALVFCFIAAVQSMMKEIYFEHDLYPLVMDAPFSNFDKRRITHISNLLVEHFGEVILLIKDSDGEIAHDILEDHITREYELFKCDGDSNHETQVRIVS